VCVKPHVINRANKRVRIFRAAVMKAGISIHPADTRGIAVAVQPRGAGRPNQLAVQIRPQRILLNGFRSIDHKRDMMPTAGLNFVRGDKLLRPTHQFRTRVLRRWIGPRADVQTAVVDIDRESDRVAPFLVDHLFLGVHGGIDHIVPGGDGQLLAWLSEKIACRHLQILPLFSQKKRFAMPSLTTDLRAV